MGVILGSPSRVTGTDGAGGRSAQAKRGLRMRESLSHGRGNGMVSFLGRLSILSAFGFRFFLCGLVPMTDPRYAVMPSPARSAWLPCIVHRRTFVLGVAPAAHAAHVSDRGLRCGYVHIFTPMTVVYRLLVSCFDF